jgi:hypothetical protein
MTILADTKLAMILQSNKCPVNAGSAKANGREPKTSLGQVFNSKLGCIATQGSKCMVCMQPLLKL